MITVRVEGIDRVQRTLGRNITPVLQSVTMAVATEIHGKIAPYPPASAANMPGGPGSQWYERGYGPRWMTMRGQIRGRRTSQTLGRRWSVSGWGRIGAVVRNIASYSPFVHSHEQRAWFHKRRGWVSDEEAVDKVLRSGAIDRIVDAVIMRHYGA